GLPLRPRGHHGDGNQEKNDCEETRAQLHRAPTCKVGQGMAGREEVSNGLVLLVALLCASW
ncbi:MAG: hypothetical protein L0Z53_14505, partial [Acidobacteriales bacterium]|nr:hypothetical protein [Terriglobales bacterium]